MSDIPSMIENLFQDPHWPRANEWFEGKHAERTLTQLGVIGAPLNCSLTPGRCDLAPGVIREVLKRYSPYDVQHNADLLSIDIRDAGDLDIAKMDPEEACAPIRDAMIPFREKNTPIILLGGDNGITRPGMLGLNTDLSRCGLLTLDAHFDLRDLDRGLHNGNPVRALLQDGLPGQNIVQIGIQSFANSAYYTQIARDVGITFLTAADVFNDGIERTMKTAFEQLRQMDIIYFDLDLDVLDRTFSPATPGSRPGGLLPWQVRQAAYLCGTHYNVCVMDLVEMDPEKDINETTAQTAAACFLAFAAGTFERRIEK